MKKIKKEYYLIAILLILFIALTVFVVGDKTIGLDEGVFNRLSTLKTDSLTKFLYVITTLASTAGIVVLLVFTMVLFLRKKALSDFKYVVGNVAVAVVLMQTLKLIIKRVRPAWKWIVQDGFSYPSGHTISAFVFYGTLILLVNKKVKGKLRKPLISLLSLMIILTGISRVYFGVHYLTDVLASVILGSIILIVSNIFMNKEFNDDKNKVKPSV
ncbi:MAG: phosphatase PAP2 family protein [Bacilli bacterium]|nr:phosphatase PAP2 family protein [Bacilli bacterium]